MILNYFKLFLFITPATTDIYFKTFFKLVLLNNREVSPPVQTVGLLLDCNHLADHAEYISIDFVLT